MAFLTRTLVLALLVAAPLQAESLTYGRFGEIPLFRPAGPPSQLVLLLADSTAQIAQRAGTLTAAGALVAGVDVPRYLAAAGANKTFCVYPAADLEGLGRFVAGTLTPASLPPPVLVADGDAGGLAYAALAQSPPGTFSGLLTVGFCPLYTFPRPLCGGNSLRTDWDWKKSGVRLRPESDLDDPWVALAVPGPACEAGSLAEFAAPIQRAVVVPVPAEAGAGEPEARLRAGFEKLIALHQQREKERAEETKADPFPDLPLVEVPSPGPPRGPIAVMISGDGGWVGLDNRLGNRLSSAGMPVVGLDSLNYFWKARTPESGAADLTRILDHYLAAWHADSAVLIGYSQGADVLPFLVDHLPARLRSKLRYVALIGPDLRALFDFRFGSFMAGTPPPPDRPVRPEIAKLKRVKLLCIYAERETESLCRKLPPGQVKRIPMEGGHGYSKATDPMAVRLLEEAGLTGTPAKRSP
jgi:type IV secretory pathway VirJ component